MATVNKNFRIKNGLIVEGATGTINGQNILTETGGDQYILNLIGGETLVKSVASGLSVDNAGELSINRTVVDTWYDAAGAAGTAEQNAKDYADALTTTDIAEGTNLYFTEGRARDAVNPGTGVNFNRATGYIDVNLGTGLNTDGSNNIKIDRTTVDTWYDAAGAAGTAEQNAKDYADSLASNYDAAGAAGTAETNANSYTDTQLQNYTPTSSLDATVDGYGYLKSADLSGYATESYVGTAIDNLVDGAPGLLDTLNEIAAAINDDANYATTMTTALSNKQNNLTTGNGIIIDNDLIYVPTSIGSGISVTPSEVEIDRTVVDTWYDAAGAAGTAQTNAEAYADNLTNNMLDGTTPFSDININDVAKQVASRATALGSATVTAYQFNKSAFKSGKFLVKIDNGTHNEISEILVTLDSSNNVAITEYAIVGTNGSRGTITADVDATHCRIRVTPVNDSTITVAGTVFNS